MTGLTLRPVGPAAARRGPHPADGATIAVIFTAILMMIPARLVFRGLPFSLTPADAIGLLGALVWLCTHFTTTLGAAKGPSPVRTSLFVYSIALVATYFYAAASYLPGDEMNLADRSMVLVVASVGIALVVCDGVRSYERLDLVLKAVVVTGALIGIVGGLQFALNLDLTSYLKLPGLRFTQEAPAILERGGLNRVSATTGHPIEYGVVCSMVLPLALHYAFRERLLRWWACCALIAAGLLFSVSRSAVLSLVAVGVVLFIGWPRERRLIGAAVVAGFLVVVKIVMPGVLGTIFDLFANLNTDSSISYRTHDYTVAGREIAKSPWLGRGLGTWYAPKHLIFDNQYISSLVETGVIGLLVFLGLFGAALWSVLRSRYLSADPVVRDLCLALVACLVVPLLGSATFDLRSFATVTGLSFLLMGVSGAMLRATRAAVAAPGPTAEPTGRAR
ncbi:O-antigen ligase family protein [Nonomuraea sp. NN258]|uniref:O-antigen ligase family protein n=1 Tax=Nonomuraea antri TaxID=2730852 RepID=UPI0015697436|nr:O-antigen ligase family protein [Nonomuraea antri]NRQ32517.1 O-antigen ligase family protein [Nonomuraea antri]